MPSIGDIVDAKLVGKTSFVTLELPDLCPRRDIIKTLPQPCTYTASESETSLAIVMYICIKYLESKLEGDLVESKKARFGNLDAYEIHPPNTILVFSTQNQAAYLRGLIGTIIKHFHPEKLYRQCKAIADQIGVKLSTDNFASAVGLIIKSFGKSIFGVINSKVSKDDLNSLVGKYSAPSVSPGSHPKVVTSSGIKCSNKADALILHSYLTNSSIVSRVEGTTVISHSVPSKLKDKDRFSKFADKLKSFGDTCGERLLLVSLRQGFCGPKDIKSVMSVKHNVQPILSKYLKN